MPLGPSAGVISPNQPNETPTCPAKDYACLTGFDPSDYNAKTEELWQITDLAGRPWDCSRNDNVALAIQDIICGFVSNFVFAETRQGSGTLSITLPAGSSWCVFATYIGGGNGPPYTFGTSAGSSIPVLFFDQDENMASGNNAAVFAGGTTFPVAQTSGVSGLLSVKAFNLDCPV